MNSKNVWVLYFMFILACIAFIILALLFARPILTTKKTVTNSLQANFNSGNGQLNVERSVVPFQIVAPQICTAICAATFSSTQSSIIVPSAGNMLIANLFQIRGTDARVISLQVVTDFLGDDSVLGTLRQVGIFDLDTKQLLVKNYVTREHAIDNGFHTLRLPINEQPLLLPFVNYAVCCLVVGQVDRTFVQSGSAQPGSEIRWLARYEVKSDNFPNELPSPDVFTPLINNVGFASFQIQPVESETRIAFDVDTVNGFGRFPAQYLYNLNVSVQATTIIVIDPGMCIDSQNACNMVNPVSIFINTANVGIANGLDQGQMEPDQWYAVFFIISSSQGLAPAGMLSKNRQHPGVLPLGYDVVRRIGWVRTDDLGVLLKTKQTGNGARRHTFYVDEQVAFDRGYSKLDVVDYVRYKIPLDLVAPLATSVRLILRAKNPNSEAVRVNIELPDSDVITQVGHIDQRQETFFLFTLPIKSVPLPYSLNMFLDRLSTQMADNFLVQISIGVVAFYDKV